MAEITNEPRLFVPDGMAYTCHNEGVCCNVFDTIPVDDKAAEKLAQLDHSELNRLAGNEADDFIEVQDDVGSTGIKIARRTCGECSMLTGEHLCAIHALAGEAVKPRVCQDFPWRYVETPDGVFVGLSFVCPSVRANRGRLLTEQADELPLKYQHSSSVRKAPDQVMLNGRLVLTWKCYLAMEIALFNLINLDNEPLSNRLIACCLLPGFVDQMIMKLNAANHGTMSDETVMNEIIQTMKAGHYESILRVARKTTPYGARSRRMFLGMYTSFANTLHEKDKGRLRTVTGVMAHYLKHAAGFGTISLKPVDAKIQYSEVDTALIPDNGYAARQISRYMHHAIWRKDLTLFGDLTRRIRLLALNAALIPWYAKAIAVEAGRTISDQDWDEAIGYVERLYGFHSVFYRFFEQNRAFSDIVDSFVLKPGYPYVLFRP